MEIEHIVEEFKLEVLNTNKDTLYNSLNLLYKKKWCLSIFREYHDLYKCQLVYNYTKEKDTNRIRFSRKNRQFTIELISLYNIQGFKYKNHLYAETLDECIIKALNAIYEILLAMKQDNYQLLSSIYV